MDPSVFFCTVITRKIFTKSKTGAFDRQNHYRICPNAIFCLPLIEMCLKSPLIKLLLERAFMTGILICIS